MARRLLLLNGIAIFCVVLFHAAGWGFTAMFMWAHRYLPVISPNFEQAGSAWDIYFRLVEQFVIFSIPAFMFVSGCFIAIAYGRGSSKTDWKRLLHRVRNLLIPYLLWTTVIIIGQVFKVNKFKRLSLLDHINGFREPSLLLRPASYSTLSALTNHLSPGKGYSHCVIIRIWISCRGHGNRECWTGAWSRVYTPASC